MTYDLQSIRDPRIRSALATKLIQRFSDGRYTGVIRTEKPADGPEVDMIYIFDLHDVGRLYEVTNSAHTRLGNYRLMPLFAFPLTGPLLINNIHDQMYWLMDTCYPNWVRDQGRRYIAVDVAEHPSAHVREFTKAVIFNDESTDDVGMALTPSRYDRSYCTDRTANE